MNLRYLSVRDWEDVRAAYPGAVNLLRRRSLVGELRTLRASHHRNAWQTARLAELERWERDAGGAQ